ncbi:hypothetical protein [Arthrobacter pascens]|uniref:hypothetical protein n=1 Tax=Arthrobacter pascens TaxID=1677 RepID=UPI00196BB05E|nr:hypothetical protein [Arthrobacter pascens]MBN3498087.1 hypothetical protein [Arthrobacter pascens]
MHKKLAAVATASLIGVGINFSVVSPATAFSVNGHENITRTGLRGPWLPWEPSFLNLPAIEDINNEHSWMDKGFPSNNGTQDEFHFDDCEFDKSISRINGPWSNLFGPTGGYAGAVTALKNNNLFSVGDDFGRILHAAQDLYSHSNWVELGYPRSAGNVSVNDLVPFSRRGPIGSSWTIPSGGTVVSNDIILANDDWSPGPGYTVRRNGAGPFQSVLYDPRGNRVGRLLETGKGWADHECDIAWTGYSGFRHDDTRVGNILIEEGLNKDGPSASVQKQLKYEKAHALAVLQSGYEWCRLVAKAGAVDRDGLLLAMWVRPGSDPHPAKTPCAPSNITSSEHRVTVTVESVKILSDGEDSGNGEILLSAALYDNPQAFHRSIHRENRGGAMSLNAGAFVPAGQLPEPMTMCVKRGTNVNWAMHGWDNDDSASDKYGRLYDDWGDDDELLVGGTTKFSSESSGTKTLSWKDLSVRIRITQGASCS